MTLDLTLDDARLEPAASLPTREPAVQWTLLDIFDATVAAWGGRTAIDAPGARLTYAQFSAAAEELAKRLRRAGVGAGDRVGVRVASGTADLYVAILGVLKAGAAYVPVDADDPAARAEQIMGEATACAVVGDGLELDWRGPAGGRSGRPAAEDDAWVIFTSGSTGTPKGVAVTHRAAGAFVNAESELWQVLPEDRVLAGLSVAFDASCEEMWLAWAHGAALVPAPRRLVRSGVELGPWLAERQVSVISTVPTLAAIWNDDALAGVRLLILGGEACSDQLAWRLAADREVWNTYGPTEATVVSTAARLHPDTPVTIGHALNGWEAAVVGADGVPVPTGETGELVIGGVGLGRYLDAGLDRERYAPLPALGWERAYRTGDIVRETPDGFAFIGRRDHQVKIGGRRIELGEIDGQLAAVPGVRAACTVVRETAAGNKLLVGYVAGDAGPEAIHKTLAERLPASLVPLIVALDELPIATSGKVNREALPWPPPAGASGNSGGGSDQELTPTERWLIERWQQQLGPGAIAADSDFFALGGSSLAAAKLASALRERYPSLAVADIYHHRTLRELALRLEQLDGAAPPAIAPEAGSRRRWGAVQLTGLLVLFVLAVPQWMLGILVYHRILHPVAGMQVGWAWLIGAWLAFSSAPGRGLIVAAARRLLLPDLRPGRYPRNGWLASRLWFVERLTEGLRLDALAGTPWSATYARLCGHRVGRGANLATIPPTTSLTTIGADATLEGDVDLHGWFFDGRELVIGEILVGDGARVGARTLLMPGAQIGRGAEIEFGSVVSGVVGPGERWAGSPAVRVGQAGERWPAEAPAAGRHAHLWKLMFAGGLAFGNMLALISAIPAIALALLLAPHGRAMRGVALEVLAFSPVFAALFILTEALIVALGVRWVSQLIRPGLQPAFGRTGWALWFTDGLMAGSRGALFSLYASVYTRPFLRLAGVNVGRRAEVSTAVGINRLSTLADKSFAADDVVFAHGRSRNGWLDVAPISVGERTFLGNSALLEPGTRLGDDSLVGLMTTAPLAPRNGTSWFGMPAIELPRTPHAADPRRTTEPTWGLIVGRAATELFRIMFPATASVVLGSLLFYGLDAVGAGGGLWLMALVTPFALFAAGVLAVALTVAAKWLIIGRYRPGDHPLWSFFVWRDEIINSAQEQLAGPWLLDGALGTPLMPLYLRAMGARVGRDVWCETLNITEFDVLDIGDDVVANRHSVLETHLFHDRVLQIGPGRLGAGATLGPHSATLPDTVIGEGCYIGGRSIVMRGETLPPHTRWHGAPVVAE